MRFATLDPMLVLNNVSVVRGNRTVLSGMNLRVEPGEMLCVLGKSGSGKTTIVELLSGLTTPTSGTVEVDGMDLQMIPPRALQLYRRRLGIVFEDGKLLPFRTVAENVGFPLEVCGAPDSATDRRVVEALKRVDLLDRADELPGHLTADERLRAGIARAIVHKPLIILMDEPLALLDSDEAKTVKDLIKEIHAAGTTVVVFTHDAALTEDLGGRVIPLSKGTIKTPAAVMKQEIVKHEVFEKTDFQPVAPAPAPTVIREEPVPTPRKQSSVSVMEEDDEPKKVHEKKHAGGRKIRVTSIHSD